MACFFSGKIMSSLVPHGSFHALFRRGYTAEAMAASQRVASTSAAEGIPARSNGMMKKEESETSTEKAAWVPDPVTGYYRPENYADVIDAVDLRAKLLKPRRNIIN
ncbi:protein SENESCENCE-ASSOCIATED GENE 21, mitochondrial-like [Benincasa hispida]|uniref:protein SENESCENCE-ASSOCIATED GENE 21, mitochondrial-like n=1 Tax=Benincasa hispida TaxID=102211 RepID=UPI001900E6F1|nr:protein SENESCENCE-ASSOCIATED GENE 21, mitochondrial-like [Benincasa hispida]